MLFIAEVVKQDISYFELAITLPLLPPQNNLFSTCVLSCSVSATGRKWSWGFYYTLSACPSVENQTGFLYHLAGV